MNVCVFGAGAVGGQVATRLAASGLAELSVVARGANLIAIRERGLRLHRDGQVVEVRPFAATDDATELPPQDLVIVTLKAPALPRAAEAIARLLAVDGCALFITNGIPWWWNHGQADEAGPLQLLDPAGTLWRLLRQRCLGGVCNAASEMSAPGVVQASANDRWLLGDPTTPSSHRLSRVCELFRQAGFAVTASADLRRDVLRKLLVNACLNPICALTRLPTRAACLDPALRTLMAAVAQETLAVARALGYDLDRETDIVALTSPDVRSPIHRTSMLQDALIERSLETEAILGQLEAFGRDRSVPMSAVTLLLTLLRGLDRSFRG